MTSSEHAELLARLATTNHVASTTTGALVHWAQRGVMHGNVHMVCGTRSNVGTSARGLSEELPMDEVAARVTCSKCSRRAAAVAPEQSPELSPRAVRVAAFWADFDAAQAL